ncbi:ATP-binding protein [Methyloferula stellata]|uniref:ATP-binding protein n=1 Tax=Methyloferula stellata TaxID=876270 RepID=UPI0012683254|nr:ATP-binding protein [Methyloferula stellata]
MIARIGDFLKIANGLAAPDREKLLAWFEADHPHLDMKAETVPAQTSTSAQNNKVVEALQSYVGPAIGVTGTDASGRQRIGFRFEDGTSITMAAPPGDGEHRPPPDRGPPPPDRGLPGEFGRGAMPPPPSPMIPVVFGTLLFFAISFTIFILWAGRGLTRPLRRFAEAVDEFSVKGTMALVEESGPSELRGAARALNRMSERVKTMIEQRTQMLAAVSHDLRTPVTRLRLRAEFIEPSDVRDPILRDIEQMDAMVHSALSFIRDGKEVQRNALLDLSALLQTICNEFADMGYKVHFDAAEPISIKGNVDELYRAVTNLVSNAVKFGTEVEVRLRCASLDWIEIDVIDDGPGIPEADKAAMLAPFTRGDESRKADALQGFGLGLPIVQAIVTAHRGQLHLLDRKPHGLIARITLPRA